MGCLRTPSYPLLELLDLDITAIKCFLSPRTRTGATAEFATKHLGRESLPVFLLRAGPLGLQDSQRSGVHRKRGTTSVQ